MGRAQVASTASRPALAKNARTGHPGSDMETKASLWRRVGVLSVLKGSLFWHAWPQGDACRVPHTFASFVNVWVSAPPRSSRFLPGAPPFAPFERCDCTPRPSLEFANSAPTHPEIQPDNLTPCPIIVVNYSPARPQPQSNLSSLKSTLCAKS